MSASAKKRLRKEQNSAQLTEKQLKEQKETKKLKLYTRIFVIAIVAILVAALVFTGVNFFKNSGFVEKNTVAAVVNGEEMNSVELSYYYSDMITSTYNEWSNSYGENLSLFLSFMGLDITLPLDEQEYTPGITWSDYFIETALEKAASDYQLAAAAEAEGFVVPEDELTTLDSTFSLLEAYAALYGYADVEAYLRAIYGPGANSETYYDYSYKAVVASAYYNAYGESLEIDDAAVRAYEAENYNKFSSFSFASYHLGHTDYLTGGTEGEDGTIVYSAEEEAAARAAAKADAEKLVGCTTVEELDAAIAALPVNEGSLTAKSTTFTNSLYSSVSTMYVDWMADNSRKAGDCTIIENETAVTNDDGSTENVVNDYYVVLYLGREDNNMPLANIRHILVNFECNDTENHVHADDGHTHTDDGHEHIEYTAEEKAAAYAKAEEILNQYLSGDKTDESFAALATEHSDDTASTVIGGLYEDITPVAGLYVEEFQNWAMDPAREAGETGIIETIYGYHVMYYVGDDELTYRDHMIIEEIRSNEITAWYTGLVSTDVIELKDASRLTTDIVLGSN